MNKQLFFVKRPEGEADASTWSLETNPIPVKTAMNLMGMKVGKTRLPLTDMNKKNLIKLMDTMIDYGLIVGGKSYDEGDN